MTDRQVIASEALSSEHDRSATVAAPASSSADLSRGWQRAILVLLLGVFVALGWSARAKIELRSGDELTYFSLSQAIEQGSYREIYRPSAPRHIKYPPGYPAWLVVARAAVAEHIEYIPLVNLLLVASAIAVLVLTVRRLPSDEREAWQGGWLALALLVPLCVNRGLLRLGGSYYSEALFILLCVLTLAATFRADRGDRRWAYVAIALASVTFLTRTAGLAMVAAIGLWLLFGTRRSREWLAFAAVSALSVGGWFSYVSRVQATEPSVRSYAFDMGLTPGRVPTSGDLGIVARSWVSLHEYGLYAAPIDLSLRAGDEPTVRALPLLLLFFVGVPFGLWMLWSRWRAAALFLVCYVGVLLAFPYRDFRLIVPALPILLLASAVGTWGMTERLPTTVRRSARLVYVLVLVVAGARGSAQMVERANGCDRTNPFDSAQCYDRQTRDLVSASRYLASQSPPEAASLAWRATSVAFLSQRKVESALIVTQAPPDKFGDLARSRGISTVVLTGMHDFETRQLADALIASCAEFTVASQLPAGGLILATSVAPYPDDNACEALATFRRTFRR